MGLKTDSSDSDFDLDDPFTKSHFEHTTSKAREEVLTTAAELLSKRGKFWGAHNKLLDSKPTDAAKEIVDDEVADSTRNLANVDALVETISDIHPGREVFCITDSQPDLDTVSLVYDYCKINCKSDSSFVQHLNLWGKINFRIIIFNRTASMFNSCTEDDLKVIAANILILMAITKDEAMSESCLALLEQFRGRWRPTLGDILNIFRFWVAELISPEYGEPSKFQLCVNPPQFSPQLHNIAQVMQYCTNLFNQESMFSDFGRVGLIFRIVLLIQLDVRLKCWTRLHLSQSFLSSLLQLIPQQEWDEQEKFLQLCISVHFPSEHFHNQAFLFLLLRDSSSRCRDISSYLGWRLIQQITSNDNQRILSDDNQQQMSNDNQQITSDDDQQETSSCSSNNDNQLKMSDDSQQIMSSKNQQLSNDDEQMAPEDDDRMASDEDERIASDNLQQMSPDDNQEPLNNSAFISHELNFLHLVHLLRRRYSLIMRLDYYRKYVLLSTIWSLVSTLDISASDETELKQLIEFITSYQSSVPQKLTSLDCQKFHTFITIVSMQLKTQKTILESVLNDSQSSQPTPVKQY